MQEAPPIKLKSPRAIRHQENKKRKEKKRSYQLRTRKQLIKDLNSPSSSDSKIKPSKGFQPLTQSGIKNLENCEVLTLGTSNVKVRATNPRRVTLNGARRAARKRDPTGWQSLPPIL